MKIIRKQLRPLFLISFFFSLSFAATAYINPSFLLYFTNNEGVGWFFAGAMILMLLGINFFPYYIKHFGNYKVTAILLTSYPLIIFLLITVQSVWAAFILFAVMSTIGFLLTINMDVFVERFTSDQVTGRVRTTYLTFINIGWLLAPISVGYLLGEFGYRFIYVLAALLMVIPLGILLTNKSTYQRGINYKHHTTLYSFRQLKKRPELQCIFFLSFLMYLFYAFFVIYLPPYLHHQLGISWLALGAIFTLMLIPFIIFELPAGSFADKYAGESRVMAVGILILLAACLGIFWMGSANVWVWGVLIFLTRCGCALMEAMRETYFFKIVDVDDLDYINSFRNSTPLGYLAGALIGVVVTMFLPVNYLFLIVALVLVVGLRVAIKLKDV